MSTKTARETMSSTEYLLANTNHHIDQIGTIVNDVQLNRMTKQIICYMCHITPSVNAELMGTRRVLDKYAEELEDFRMALCGYITKEFTMDHHRRLIYNNMSNFATRFQCISSIQFIPLKNMDGEFRMIVYQRSGDIEKALDDWRFFCEIAYQFYEQFRRQVSSISVVYGSIHKTHESN